MIETMLKVAILCRTPEKEYALDKLRDLGVLHVEETKIPESTDLSRLKQDLDKLKQISSIISEYENHHTENTLEELSPKEAARKAVHTFEELEKNKKELEDLYKDKEKLEPWGNFYFSTIDKLSEKGINVYLCITSPYNISEFREKGTVLEVNRTKEKVYFAFVTSRKYRENELPVAKLPKGKALNQVDKEIKDLEAKQRECVSKLSELTLQKEKIYEYKNSLEERYEFEYNKQAMGGNREVSYIEGFIPENIKHTVSEAANKYGWGIYFRKPRADDNVPTKLRIPKYFRLARPIFDFIGIFPGYRELDVSVIFLFFLTIFFAMIFGDAGYGITFLVTGVLLKYFLRKKQKYQKGINLFILFSIATTIWGVLNCTYFGLPKHYFPEYMKGLKVFTDPEMKNKNIQYLCFLLAAIHLSLARLWKAALIRNSVQALGQLGWAMFIWGNFFTAVKLIVFSNSPFPVFAYYLYIIGAILILTFYVNWKDFGSVFNLPFNFLNSFVDLLSYIRLFAVGLATYYIANSFNEMGYMILNISPWLIVFAIIVLLFGHLLNIALAFMGVLVHGIRLNTLEFSNHMELQWLGKIYNPFRKRTNENSD